MLMWIDTDNGVIATSNNSVYLIQRGHDDYENRLSLSVREGEATTLLGGFQMLEGAKQAAENEGRKA